MIFSYRLIQKHIQTGKRINKPIDDLGETGKLANLNLERLSNYRTKQNLQNSISFLQSQQGKLKVVTKVLTRMGELNTLANSPIANKSTKVIYDREFKELQEEIRDIGTSKWNGISLFSSQASKVLVGNAIDAISKNGTVELPDGGHESGASGSVSHDLLPQSVCSN